jgi:hypothetical protein
MNFYYNQYIIYTMYFYNNQNIIYTMYFYNNQYIIYSAKKVTDHIFSEV